MNKKETNLHHITLSRAVAGPHLDYHQDDAKRLDFHSKYPILDDFGMNRTEPHYLVGANDTPEEKMSVLLGVWKPLSPSEVSSNFKDFICPYKHYRSVTIPWL